MYTRICGSNKKNYRLRIRNRPLIKAVTGVEVGAESAKEEKINVLMYIQNNLAKKSDVFKKKVN